MLEVYDQSFDEDKSNLVPEVYINLITIDKKNVNVYFTIGTNKNIDTWYMQEKIVNQGYAILEMGDQKYKESLASFVQKRKQNKNNIFKCTFKNNVVPAVIKAYCSTGYANSNIIEETVINSFNIIPDSSILKPGVSAGYSYLGKVIDLRLFDNTFINPYEVARGDLSGSFQPPIVKLQTASKLFVSYDSPKSSNVGFIMDLEKLLRDNSNLYRFFSANLNYKTEILANTRIESEISHFYAKNISREKQNYEKIDSPVVISKTRNNFLSSDYMISTKHQSDLHEKYQIKVELKINNYVKKFVQNSLLSDSREYKKRLINYFEDFKYTIINRTYGDEYTCKIKFYQNDFEKYIEGLIPAIEFFSTMYYMFTGANKDSYYKLFCSITHPLITNIETFSVFIQNLDRIERLILDLLDEVNKDVDLNTKTYKEDFFTFEKHFYDNDSIDYKYDAGYDVISYGGLENKNQNISSLLTLSAEDKDFRKLLEAQKYFQNVDDSIVSNISYLSISSFNIKGKGTSILNQMEKALLPSHGVLFLSILDYNLHWRDLDSLHGAYMQTADNGAYIKTISALPNSSANPLEKNIPFDKNTDSKDKSIDHMIKSGLSDLVYLTDKTKILQIPPDIYQSRSNFYSTDVSGNLQSENVLTLLNDFGRNITNQYKSTLILLYNAFFRDNLIYSFENFDIWSVEPTAVNDIFTKKMKQYNKYYIVLKQQPEAVYIKSQNYSFINEFANYNIPSEILNRTEVSGAPTITIEDLL